MASGPVLLNARSRIRNSQEYSRAATCQDFACEIREIGDHFGRSGKTVRHSQSDHAFPLATMMKQKAYEGRSFEVGSQVLISSHRKLLLSKAMVVNVAETSGLDSDRQG